MIRSRFGNRDPKKELWILFLKELYTRDVNWDILRHGTFFYIYIYTKCKMALKIVLKGMTEGAMI